jgi:hypothetical protein
MMLLQKPCCGPRQEEPGGRLWRLVIMIFRNRDVAHGDSNAFLRPASFRLGIPHYGWDGAFLPLIRKLTRQSVSRSSNLGASRCFHTSLLDHRGCTGALNLPYRRKAPARVLAALDDDVRTISGPRMTEILLRWLVTLLQEVAPMMRDQWNATCRVRKASLLNSDDLNDWQRIYYYTFRPY